MAYGLGYRKAERRLDRPPVYSDKWVYGDVIDISKEEKQEKATASIYFYANMRVLSQKVGSAQLFVKERHGEHTDHIYDHPFEKVFRRPNDLFARSDLMEHSMWWLGLNGNCYWWLTVYDKELVEIWPLPADEIEPVPDKNLIIKGYSWQPQSGQRPEFIPRDKIAHFRMVNPYSVYRGMSFLDALYYALEGSNARFKWELDFFSKQRAVPEGLLGVAPETNPDDIDRIREQLRTTYGGGERRIAVGRTGQMSFTRFGLTQEEMAFLARLQYDEQLFDRVFGFPGGYWDAKANRANAYQAEKSLAQDTVMPLLEKFAGNIEVQILNRLYEPKDQSVDLCCEFEDITPQDREEAIAEFSAYRDVLTVDEARRRLGYSIIEGEFGTMPVALIPALVQSIGLGFTSMPHIENKSIGFRRDLANWRQVAMKQVAKGKDPSSRAFVSDAIPPEVAAQIEASLVGAVDTEGVSAIFEPWLRRAELGGA